MNLLIVRHAESKGNASGDYSIATHDSLSGQGGEQAAALVDCLRSWTFDKIIVSPLLRAMETVFPYLEATHQKAEIWPEIAEACWQEQREEPSECWPTQPAALPDPIARLFTFRNDEAIKPAHPESFGEGLRRIHVTMDRIQKMDDSPNSTILMVTHGHFIRELINLMLDTRNSIRFSHGNCGMTLLSFNGTWAMEFCNRNIDRMRSTSGGT